MIDMGKHARERIERSSESYSKLHAMFHVYEDELFLGKRILSKDKKERITQSA